MSLRAKRLLYRVTHDITMPSNKRTASACAMLILLSLMIGYAGLSKGAMTAQNVIPSSGTITASGNSGGGGSGTYNLIVAPSSNGGYSLESGDGSIITSSSDAATIINTMISQSSSGYQDLIQAGTYPIYAQIGTSSVSGVTLTLASGAVLQEASDFRSNPMFELRSVSNWVIQGESDVLYAGEISGYSTSDTDNAGIAFAGCTNCIIQNTFITNFGCDIAFISGSTGCTVNNCQVTYGLWNGVDFGYSGSGCSDCTVQNSLIEYCSDVGLDSMQSSNCQFISNTVAHTNQYYHPGQNSHWGIALETNGGPITNFLIENNIVYDCPINTQLGYGGYGIVITRGTPTSNSISDNNGNQAINNNVYDCNVNYSSG